MRGLVAFVKGPHVEFAVVSVQEYIMNGSMSHKNKLITDFTREFGAPAVLMSQGAQGELEFFGRLELSQWLAKNILDPSQLLWREFSLAA
jgi:hypothetical protein